MALAMIDQNELKAKLGEGRAVVVDFYADWCAPCRALTPELEVLKERHGADIEFVKLDSDANPELVMELGIMSIPTVIHFSANGDEVGRTVGAMKAEILGRKLGL